jgi:methionine-S-sulfoxide reductase
MFQKITLTVLALFLTNSSITLAAATVKASQNQIETATFAAGCFWGSEEFFRKIPGVIETRVGYTGGKAKADYEQVSSGKTGHAESVEIKFDPKKVSYNELLADFFKMHDPTTLNRQGNDEGTQYRSAIFTHTEEQRKDAQKFKVKAEKAWKKPIATEIADAGTFYAAEDYHQKYLVKNPGGYDNHYVRNLNFDEVKK